MTKQSKHSRCGLGCLSAALLMMAGAARAELPPKTQWKMTASHQESGGEFPAAQAADGLRNTRWSSPFEDGHWIQVDLGSTGLIGGLVVYWETAYASSYHISVSTDGREWTDVYETESGNGGSDLLFFRPVSARYIRLNCQKRATGWGSSIWEIDVLPASARPAMHGSSDAEDLPLLDGRQDTVWRSGAGSDGTITLDFKASWELGGLRIDWAEAYAKTVLLETSDDGTNWVERTRMARGVGRFDHLLFQPAAFRYLRLTLSDPVDPAGRFAVRELFFFGPDEGMDPLRMYEFAAAKAPAGLYPGALRQEQVYWTVVGLPGAQRESLFDEYGNLEPWTDGPQFMPYLRVGDALHSARSADAVLLNLADGWMPMPGVRWQLGSTEVYIQAITAPRGQEGATSVRYRLANTGTEELNGTFYLSLRPVQINPKWQHGGLAMIRQTGLESFGSHALWTWNDDGRAWLHPAPDAFAAVNFDRGDIAEYLIANTDPPVAPPAADGSLHSGLATYVVQLSPGGTMDIVLSIPLDRSVLKPYEVDALDAFDSLHAEVSRLWSDRLGDMDLELPQAGVANTFKSQAAYILINRDGPALQPGSRNYNRSWMRDGCLTSAALLRMGLTEDARTYLEWYAQRQYENGMVPPILNTDGTVNHGYGGDIEYDSQGQFVFALMEYFRFTRDYGFLERHFDHILRALEFTRVLRERTLAADYMAGADAPERFRGILPASISHEGYSTPHHSYWDDFWALKGWKDGEQAAILLNRTNEARWARSEYFKLKSGVASSIAATMTYKQIPYIPGSADLGDPDATSVAIALYPCMERDLFNIEEIEHTFLSYFNYIQEREKPGWSGKYTPYEVRNILALQLLGFPAKAVALHDALFKDRRPPAWNHFAEVVLGDYRQGSYIGDMPHTWVGSGYVNSLRGMLVQERGTELHLLPSVPSRWLEDAGVRFGDLPTHFGTMNLEARIEGDVLEVKWDKLEYPPEKVVVYTPVEWGGRGVVLPSNREQVRISLSEGSDR